MFVRREKKIKGAPAFPARDPVLEDVRQLRRGRICGRTAEQGARQYIWAALGPDGKDGPHVKSTMNGAYVSLACTREPSDFVVRKEGYEAQERIWVRTCPFF